MSSPAAAKISQFRAILQLSRDIVGGRNGDPAAAAVQLATFIDEIASSFGGAIRGSMDPTDPDAVRAGTVSLMPRALASTMPMLDADPEGKQALLALAEDLGVLDLFGPSAPPFAPGSYMPPGQEPDGGPIFEDRTEPDDIDPAAVELDDDGPQIQCLEVDTWSGSRVRLDVDDASGWLGWARGWIGSESAESVHARIDGVRALMDSELGADALAHVGSHSDLIMKYHEQITPLVNALAADNPVTVRLAVIFVSEDLARDIVQHGRGVRLSDEDHALARALPFDPEMAPSEQQPVAIIALSPSRPRDEPREIREYSTLKLD